MPAITALHRLLGREPGLVTDELISAAVSAGLRETDDLDWKTGPPPSTNLADSEFPKDVAAMANSGGGVIVYGVDESEKAATRRTDAGGLLETHARALRAVAYSAIRPPVLGLEIIEVGEEPTRAIVVVVPPSVEGPHLIFKNLMFGAPFRNDADTAWMGERQIEATYRARLDERRRSTEALTTLYSEAHRNWTKPATRAWMIAVAHPRVPASSPGRWTRDLARIAFSEASELALTFAGGNIPHPLRSVDRANPRPGLRRWVAPNIRTGDGDYRAAWAAIHDDRSVTVAAAIGGHFGLNGVVNLPSEVHADAIEAFVADFMALIRISSGYSGEIEYEVRLGIEQATPKPLTIQAHDRMGFRVDEDAFGLATYAPVVGSVDTRVSPQDFHWQVHDLALDCVNQGGIMALRQIRPPQRAADPMPTLEP